MVGGSVKAQQKIARELYRTYRKSVGWSAALLLTSLALDVHQDFIKDALGWNRGA